MIGILERLFKSKQQVQLEQLKEALTEVERDRRRVRVDIRRWERRRKQIVDKMKKARGAGSQLEVDYLWAEFKEHRLEGNDLRREGRASNLEGIALRRYVRALERMEKRKDHTSARNLLERIAHSGLAERIAFDRESQTRYLDEVNTILEEFDGTEEEREDPEKALFLAELDGIRKAEEQGESDEATERQEELIDRFGMLPEEEA